MRKKPWWIQADEPRLLWWWRDSLDLADLKREIELAVDRAIALKGDI